MRTRRTLIAAAVTAIVLTISGCAMFMPGLVDCPSSCSVDISFPADVKDPPRTPDPYVRVKAGQQVEFRSAQEALVVFTGDTPFVDSSGDPLYWFKVSTSATVSVRNDRTGICVGGPGCKYMVIDGNNAGRPVLDPYFIIDR